MIKKIDTKAARVRRHARVRKNISGTAERPRLNVFRSAKHIYAQVIDDVKGVTLVSASSMDKEFEGYGGNVEGAKAIGQKVAEKALAAGIRQRRICISRQSCCSCRRRKRRRLGILIEGGRDKWLKE